MKHTLYFIVVFLFVKCYGQEVAPSQLESRQKSKLYLNIGAGVNFPAFSDPFGGNSITRLYTNNDYNYTFNKKRSSYSDGTIGRLGIGVMFNKHIGMEIGSGIGIANKIASSQNIGIDATNNVYHSHKTDRYTNAPVLATGSMVFHSCGKLIDVYTKIGIAAPVSIKQFRNEESEYQDTVRKQSYAYTNKFTIGFSGSIGLSYRISPQLQLWAEGNVVSFKPYIKKRELITSSVNGVNDLPTLSQEQKSTTYSFSGLYTESNPTSWADYSSAGINAGITVNLGKNGDVENPISVHKIQHLYFKIGFGYSLPLSIGNRADGTEVLDELQDPLRFTGTFTYKPSSYFTGINNSLGAGYLVNQHIGFELNVTTGVMNKKSVLNHTEYNQKQTMICNNVTTVFYTNFYESTTRYSQAPMILTPSIMLQSGGQKINIYSRLGLAIPVRAKVIENVRYLPSLNAAVPNLEMITEYSTRLTMGYTMAAGISFRISKHLQLWGEANFLSLNPYLKSSKLTAFNSYGIDMLKNYPQEAWTKTYAFSGSDQNTNATYTVPFSNAGIQLGMSFFK